MAACRRCHAVAEFARAVNAMDAVTIDFETTGAVPGYRNEPWQVGIAFIRAGRIDSDLFESLLHIGERPFNKHAPGRHAQLRTQLAIAPTMQELWPTIFPRLSGTVLVAHNVGTERAMLSAASPLHVLGPWIDTLTLARTAWPGMLSYALEALIPAFGLTQKVESRCPGRAPHDALYDAIACAELLLHLLRQPAWQDISSSELVTMCRR